MTGLVAAGGEQSFTGLTCIWQCAETAVSCNAVHTGPSIQARCRRALINIGLAQVTYKSICAAADGYARLVHHAGSTVLAKKYGTAVGAPSVTGSAMPAWVAFTCVPVTGLAACAVNAPRYTELSGVTQRVTWPTVLWADTSEAAIHNLAATPSLAWVRRTGGHLYVTEGTCKSWFTHTVVSVDAIFAFAIFAWIAGTVIEIVLTVNAGGTLLAVTQVLVDQVNAFPSMETRVTVTFVNLVLATIAGVPRITGAGEAGDAIAALPMVAWVRRALVNVTFTQRTFKTLRTPAFVTVGSIHAFGSVLAGRTGAFVNINLTHGACETGRTTTGEPIDHIFTDSAVNTRAAVTLIDVELTECTSKSSHADTSELSDTVQAGGIILARGG